MAEGDVLMPHASLRAIGPVEGGAAAVVAALDQAVGPSGTLLMNVGVRDDWSWVQDEPEFERPRLLEGSPPFDTLTAPADPDNGVLAEVFRQTPGSVVSDHPEGRFGARGRLARKFVVDQPWNDYYGPGSPLEMLVRAGGKVLRLGADESTVTLLHYAENLAPVPNKRRVRRHRLVQTPAGPEVRAIECLDDSNGIVDWEGEDYFALILRAYLATGGATQGVVGNARSELIDAAELVDFAVFWMAEHFVSVA